MARKPNYDFERRKKEQERRDKKEAKREERARRKAAGLPDDEFGVLDENGDLVRPEDTPAGDAEAPAEDARPDA